MVSNGHLRDPGPVCRETRRLSLEGGFHEGLALLRGPPGIMLTLTAPQMRRKGTSPNTLASAMLQTGEAAAHPAT